MALFLNKTANGNLEVCQYSNENTFARIEYYYGNGYDDRYTFNYVSFKAPKIPVYELKLSLWVSKDSYGYEVKKGSIYTTIKDGETEYRIGYSTENSIACPSVSSHYNQNDFVTDFFNFIYSFNSVEDVYEVCTARHPTSYQDAISLSQKIASIATILNGLEIGSRGAGYLISWLKLALLRFDIILKNDDGNGEKTQFTTLDPIFAKHKLALYNK